MYTTGLEILLLLAPPERAEKRGEERKCVVRKGNKRSTIITWYGEVRARVVVVGEEEEDGSIRCRESLQQYYEGVVKDPFQVYMCFLLCCGTCRRLLLYFLGATQASFSPSKLPSSYVFSSNWRPAFIFFVFTHVSTVSLTEFSPPNLSSLP